MSDITILSCPQCGFPRIRDCGNGLYQCDDCGTHFDKDENIVLTEQEYLQICDTEQLATFLAIVQYDGTDLTLKKNHVEKWVEWLKQPHTDI